MVATNSKTWWGQKFLAALETNMDSGRLSRGRSYATDNRLKTWKIDGGRAQAKVRGNINRYFGVYKEPTYTTTVELRAISKQNWQKIIKHLCSRASFVSKLVMGEMPDNIDVSMKTLRINLLPNDDRDFNTDCSCPDWANPCKHVAGVCNRLASLLDQDPFLIFELRGLSREELRKELLKSPLGKVLASSLDSDSLEPVVSDSYFSRPSPVDKITSTTVNQYWKPTQPLPSRMEPTTTSPLSAVLIKKGGNYPPFWHKDNSFIDTMEEFYERVKTKNKAVF
jgi:uncharacterized Zn finger protein